MESGEIFHPLGLSANDSYTVLKEIPLYEESGILCRIPNWWRNKSDSLKISVKIGNDNPSYLSFDTIVDFNIELSLGGESISEKEARKMLSEAEGLAFIKGKWVEVDHQKLTETLKAYEEARKLTGESGMSLMEAMKTYAPLSKKQAFLYSKLVEDLRTILETDVEGIERKGLILASLMKFKQICNHPDQYLGQNYYAEDESGKYSRLREICETIYDKRERVLVFTQFKEITAPLESFLEKIFQHKGLVLHGEIPVAKRKDIVAEFQGHEYVPFLVLSIKAGGVGLNLTKANHVIHFDRWWNPAVENQATDRAFRIGQQKNVIVHKFITQGTIEEKIDLMIEDKVKMSQEIIPDLQEKWITEMDNKQLLELFRLSG